MGASDVVSPATAVMAGAVARASDMARPPQRPGLMVCLTTCADFYAEKSAEAGALFDGTLLSVGAHGMQQRVDELVALYPGQPASLPTARRLFEAFWVAMLPRGATADVLRRCRPPLH